MNIVSSPPPLTESDRDSAVSLDNEVHLTEDQLGSFVTPPSYIHPHLLDNIQYPTVLNRIRETLIMCRQKATPAEQRRGRGGAQSPGDMNRVIEVVSKKKTRRSISSSSQTSLDSTGSSETKQTDALDESKSSPTDGVAAAATTTVAHMTNGDSSHMTNGDGHVTANGDDVHVTNNGDDCTSVDTTKSSSPSSEKKRPSSLHGIQSLDSNSRGSCSNSEDTPHSCDRLSLMSDDISETSLDNPALRRPATAGGGGNNSSSEPSPRLLARRMTCPSNMQVKRSSILTSNSLTSATSPTSRRYSNVASQMKGVGAGGRSNSLQRTAVSLSGSGMGGSISTNSRVKMRRNPSGMNHSIKRRASILTSTSSSSSLTSSASSNAAKVIKILLAGNDRLLSNAAKAYAHLQVEEPNLVSSLDLRFYYVPLSRASLLYSQHPELALRSSLPSQMSMSSGGGGVGGGGSSSALPLSSGASFELPEPMFEQIDLSGNDVHIGRFLGHMDSWYERNLMMAVHHLLRLLPSVSFFVKPYLKISFFPP